MNDKYDIKSFNQLGGITAGKVYIDTKGQRKIKELPGFENELLNAIPKDKGKEIVISAIYGDSEAYTFASEILNFISSKGWTNVNGVKITIGAKPITDVNIYEKDNKFNIHIGERKSY